MKVTIKAGPATVEVENGDAQNIGDLLAELRASGLLAELNIPDGATPIVNGANADAATPLTEGAEVAFNKPAGQKG